MKGGKHQVARQSSLDADGRGFLVAHFPDHDPVGILAKEGPEHPREIKADGFVDRDLDNAVDVILDGILGGEELGIDGIDPAQRCVEGRRFSSTRRTGDDEDAVWLLDRLGDVVVDVIGEAEIFQREIH